MNTEKINEERPADSAAGAGFFERWGDWISWLVLTLGILAVYWPVAGFNFINADDPIYPGNAHVRAGITWEGLKWAFQTSDGGNWHPLTWISHMLDTEMFGGKAGGPHAVNVLFHIINSGLLYALVFWLTGKRGRSFVVAALFAWHPLHVESVAWVAERKDVLSTFFWLLTMIAYAKYVERSKVRSPKSKVFYGLALVCFALGLMSKPMLVTLPFVLLLMDYWPLKRISDGKDLRTSPSPKTPSITLSGLLWEKVPFLLLAALSCVATLRAQKVVGALITVETLPLARRLPNAILSYYRYIGKIFWPTDLSILYPFGHLAMDWSIWLAGTVLLIFSAGVLRLKKFPYVEMGWLWFVGTLVPVIGLVQVGSQGMADRYAYIPSMGLFLLIVFAASDLAARFRNGKILLTMTATVALAGCLVVAGQQVRYWRNSETVFRHATEVTQYNFLAYNNLGVALYDEGRVEDSVTCFKTAFSFFPNYADAHFNLGNAYSALKQSENAMAEYRTALRLNPAQLRAHYYLANLLFAAGDAAGAAENYQGELALNPNHAEAHYQMATLLLAKNENEAAMRHYREAIRIRPGWPEPLNNLAWLLATQPDARLRDGGEAVRLASRAVELTHTNDPGTLDTLAGALAEAGQFPEAVKTAKAAANLAEAAKLEPLARTIREHAQLYERSQPFREPVPVDMKSGKPVTGSNSAGKKVE